MFGNKNIETELTDSQLETHIFHRLLNFRALRRQSFGVMDVENKENDRKGDRDQGESQIIIYSGCVMKAGRRISGWNSAQWWILQWLHYNTDFAHASFSRYEKTYIIWNMTNNIKFLLL